jgi:tetratricopeptide (TPR) repeat protein/Mn-dependent DtxR family transcriptional regulator
MSQVNYPPKEIYKPPVLEKKNFEHIILWMLYNNEECEWANFTQKPLELRLSTLSKYLSLLKGRGYVENISRGHYKITSEGKKRYLELSQTKGTKRSVSYPPYIIKRRRNYDHWILWMVYNNNFCKWADFLAEPLNINQSSLSKNINLLLDKGLIEKEEKKYRITRSGKLKYSNMLENYDLDKQSILEEESKRIEEIATKTVKFFDKFDITDENVQFRLLNNMLKLDYTRVESMLTNEEDFYKILLFISINHPSQYPNYVPPEKFSTIYGVKDSKLYYYLDEIVENQIFPIKFFKITSPSDMHFYFQEGERLEIMLRAITEDYITKFTYLNKLFSRSLDIKNTISEILEDICNILFHEDLKEPLRKFLPKYINYLAYKIEAKVELKESYDKLEGIIWQDMIDIFQAKSVEGLQEDYKAEIKKIDEKIESSPENLDIYYSKIRILIYYNQFDDVLNLLDAILDIFPKDELDIMMKKASVLRRMQEVNSGLEIINNLIEKYPENNDLINYKAYWLQYLDKKEESLGIIKNLVEKIPDNGMYHDTYGEILMYFEEYDEAIDEFLKAIELASDKWYIHQTYIKLGICYKELKDLESASKHLKKGKTLTQKSSMDAEMKQKWITIANLFLLEIKDLES